MNSLMNDLKRLIFIQIFGKTKVLALEVHHTQSHKHTRARANTHTLKSTYAGDMSLTIEPSEVRIKSFRLSHLDFIDYKSNIVIVS